MNTDSMHKVFAGNGSFDLNDIDLDSFECSEDIDREESQYSVDTLGSCGNSPKESSEYSSSPTPTESENENIFVFSTKHLDSPAKINKNFAKVSQVKSQTGIARKLEERRKRNERERRRVQRLADGFRRLREVVPGKHKKLSKLDTLRRALDYMSKLVDIVGQQDCQTYNSVMYDNTNLKTERLQHSPEFQTCQVPIFQTPIYQPSTYPQSVQNQQINNWITHNASQQPMTYTAPDIPTPNMGQAMYEPIDYYWSF